MDDSSNPLINALDRQSAAIDGMAAAVTAANPAAVRSAIAEGLEQGLGSAPAELKAALDAARKAAEAGVASAEILTARRIWDYQMVAVISGGLVAVALAFGWLIGTWDSNDRMAAAVVEEDARMAPAVAASAWVGTPSGQAARALDRTGALDMLAHCTAPGLHRRQWNGRDICSPDARFTGWFLD